MLRKTERLTERDRKTGIASSVWHDKSIPCRRDDMLAAEWCPDENCVDTNCDFRRILDKLAAYEDTRMTPEEVIAMKEREKRRRNKNNEKLLKQR